MKSKLFKNVIITFDNLFKYAEDISSRNKPLDLKFYLFAGYTIWCLLSISVLAIGIYSAINEHINPSTNLWFLWASYIVNFPSSIILSIFLEVIFIGDTHAKVINASILSSICINCFTWLLFTISGYIQWFIVLPKVINKILNTKNKS